MSLEAAPSEGGNGAQQRKDLIRDAAGAGIRAPPTLLSCRLKPRVEAVSRQLLGAAWSYGVEAVGERLLGAAWSCGSSRGAAVGRSLRLDDAGDAPLIEMPITNASAMAKSGAHAMMTSVSFHDVRKPMPTPTSSELE